MIHHYIPLDYIYLDSEYNNMTGDPATPYLLHPEHGSDLNMQLLSGYLLYPGTARSARKDRVGQKASN